MKIKFFPLMYTPLFNAPGRWKYCGLPWLAWTWRLPFTHRGRCVRILGFSFGYYCVS